MNTTAPHSDPAPRRILVTGASGYIGGRLVPALLDDPAGTTTVRVLTRAREGIAGQPWAERVEVVVGDAGSPEVLQRALAQVDVAYYLIHSMDDGAFADHDRRVATAFAQEAARAGVSRIVYLGGMNPAGEELSEHLRSRVEIGKIFLDGPVPAACLQAAIVLGDGSASFAMLRYLTSRLPVMVTPSWVENPVQPIAIDDAVRCLQAAADLPPQENRTFDIAGPQVVSYRELMQIFARTTGLRERVICPMPVLTPRLASLWVGAITPVPAALARPLVGSLIHPMVAQENDLDNYLDRPCETTIEAAIRQAMRHARPDAGPRILAGCSLAVATTATVGSLATDPDSRWYRRLDTPSWQPPKLAFPIAWTALYALITGASAAHLTQLDREERGGEAAAYRKALGGNLTLNALWSILFFRSHRLPVAAVEAVALAASSTDLARRAGTTRPRRAALLAPYAGWCTFAAALTIDIARRNRRKSS